MVKRELVAEGVDLLDAEGIVQNLMREGKKITIDPLNDKFWIFDYGKPKR